jgi:hypothetical protein
MADPKTFLDRYTNLTFTNPLDNTKVTVQITAFKPSGKSFLFDKTPLANVPAIETFTEWGFVKAFLGKGMPLLPENPVHTCAYYHASRKQRGPDGHFYGDRKPWRYGFQGGLGCFGHATCDHFPSIEGSTGRLRGARPADRT